MDIAQLGIQVNSQPAVKATDDLDRLTVAAGRADVATDNLAAQTSRAGGMSAQSAHGFKQLAFQLNQVGQMGAVTGNYMQALAIQIPDITSSFGFLGAMAGGVAAFALPALVSAIGTTGSAAERLTTAVEDLQDASEAYAEAVQNSFVTMDELVEKYGTMATAAQELALAMTEVAQVQAMEALAASIEALADPIQGLSQASEHLGEVEWRFLAEELGIAEDAAVMLSIAVDRLSNAEGPEAQARAAADLAAYLDRSAGGYANMNTEARRVYDAAIKIAQEAAEIAGATQRAGDAAGTANRQFATMNDLLGSASQAAGAVQGAVQGIASAAASAADAVAGLAARMWEAAQARAAAENQLDAMKMEFSPAGQALEKWGGRGTSSTRPVTMGDGTTLSTSGNGAGGGGGGGAADQYASNLEALVNSLQSERETLDEWYAENQAILADRRAQEILGTQAHKDALLALEQEYQERLADIEGTAQDRRLTDSASFFGSLAAVAQAGGQKTTKVVAAFQAVEGTINAYGAAVKALNTPGLTLAGRFAAYASVLAAGLQGVAAIRSAGGIGGGGGRVASVAAQGQQQAQTQVQTVEYTVRGLDRDGLYTGDMLARIFDGITEEAQKRGLQTAIRFV